VRAPAERHQPAPERGNLIIVTAHSSPQSSGRRRRLIIYSVLAPLGLLLLLWLWLFATEGAFSGGPNGKSFEADFAMFDSAAQVLQHDENPYDRALLFRTEKSLLAKDKLPIVSNPAIVRVGNPPLLFWGLQSVTGLPFQPTAVIWGILLYLLSALGLLALLSHLGWRRKVVPLVLFLAMPQVVLGAFYGNPVPIIFAAVAFALCLRENHPVLTGILLVTCWLKPPVALPVAGLVLLFHARDRMRTSCAFGAGSALFFLVTPLLAGGAALGNWIHALHSYADDLAVSPDISSLSGLFVRVVAPGARTLLQTLIIGIALAATLAVWHHRRGREFTYLDVAWLWMLWFLVAPYAHFYDEILLAIPVFALLGRDAKNLTFPASVISIYLLFFSLLVFQASARGVQVICLFLVPIVVILARASWAARPGISAVPIRLSATERSGRS
jgi:Glycosyltransferase family 87